MIIYLAKILYIRKIKYGQIIQILFDSIQNVLS